MDSPPLDRSSYDSCNASRLFGVGFALCTSDVDRSLPLLSSCNHLLALSKLPGVREFVSAGHRLVNLSIALNLSLLLLDRNSHRRGE